MVSFCRGLKFKREADKNLKVNKAMTYISTKALFEHDIKFILYGIYCIL